MISTLLIIYVLFAFILKVEKEYLYKVMMATSLAGFVPLVILAIYGWLTGGMSSLLLILMIVI